MNLILFKVCSKEKIAIASSGIAPTLLKGGRTAHPAFKLPFNLYNSDETICNIARGTAKPKLFQECGVIVWDVNTDDT